MVKTRSSTGGAGSSPQSDKSSPNKNSGTKRKADEASPSSKAKRGRPAKAKEQKTLEETMPDAEEEQPATKGVETNDSELVETEHEAGGAEEAKTENTEGAKANGVDNAASQNDEQAKDTATNGDQPTATQDEEAGIAATSGDKGDESTVAHEPTESAETIKKTDESSKPVEEPTKTEDSANSAEKAEEPPAKNALDQVKADVGEGGTTTAEKSEEKEAEVEVSNEATEDAVEEDKEREKAMPSNILEKGIIYFFTRGRVGVEDPDSVQDLARSYFVLRPLPDGAKLTDGAIQDVGNNRLLALPKKVWPKSGKDRFMVFVDKAKVSMATLKEEFFQGSDYSTQTMGTRHAPEVTPLGEGVYAMTSTGGGQGTTHLAYMLTIPSDIGEVQKDVGLKEKGSFVLSIKNPEASAPPNAQLPATAEYPKEIIEEFRGRSWMPAHPKHIDYNNASLLLIGEDFESSSNLDPTPKDEKHDEKVTPQEELEKLENEDELRVEHLKGDDTIFADLGISSKEYPKVMTTW